MKVKKTLFYILNLTWGLPMTLMGVIVALVMLITGHKPHRHGGCIYFHAGNSWGGIELGLFFVTDNRQSIITKNHEFGHAIQNCLWGPLFPFVIAIPSAIRYWIRRFRTSRGLINPPYDSIWFEGQATRLGTKAITLWAKKLS